MPKDVRDTINITEAQLTDEILHKMLKRAEVIVEAETGLALDYTNCSDIEKEAIVLIAGLAALNYLGGTTASQISNVSGYTLGPLTVNSSSKSGTQSDPSAQRFTQMREDIDRLLKSLKDSPFEVVNGEA
jgi:hypothetical protein